MSNSQIASVTFYNTNSSMVNWSMAGQQMMQNNKINNDNELTVNAW